MFELTRTADYALRLMMEVAAQRGGALGTAEIARRQDIPYPFLRKVAQRLVSRRLLTAERGVRGGLSLARPAALISVLDVIRAIDPPALNRCTVDPSSCDRRDSCAAYPLWVEAQRQMERVLQAASLAELVRRQRRLTVVGRPAGRRQAKGTPQSVRVASPLRVIAGLDPEAGVAQEQGGFFHE